MDLGALLEIAEGKATNEAAKIPAPAPEALLCINSHCGLGNAYTRVLWRRTTDGAEGLKHALKRRKGELVIEIGMEVGSGEGGLLAEKPMTMVTQASFPTATISGRR